MNASSEILQTLAIALTKLDMKPGQHHYCGRSQ